MSAPLQIYLIRHGETAWSLSGQHTGRTELPLTRHGEEMARRLAATLNGIDFRLVLTSPRLRARATCELAGLGAAAQTEPDLAEWDYGRFEGLRTAEIRDRHPGWDLWDDGCPGGEAPADVSRRADQLIARIVDGTGRVALFSHGQIGRVIAARWIGMAANQGRHFALDPASISVLALEFDQPARRVISLWNASASGSRLAS
jgi:probable phosphoglycerate mutase